MTEDTGAGGSGGGAPDKPKTEAEIRAEVEAEVKKDYIPKTQFTAALKSQEEKLTGETSSLRQRLEALEKKPATETRYTRQQLATAVEANQITQAEADELWDRQFKADILKEADAKTESLVTVSARDTQINADLNRYITAEPDIMTHGSEIRAKIETEYKYLVSLGDPDNVATQLKATRAALGPVEALELAKAGKLQKESHKETGGSGGGGGGPTKEFKDTLTDRQKTYYQQKIDRGIYKDWDAVKAELQPKKKEAA